MHFIAFDLETTGLYPATDRIVEYGAVKFDREGKVLGRIESLVRPGIPCSPNAFAAHGLADDVLDAAPEPDEALPGLRDFLGHPRDNLLLAHNIAFDLGFLRVAFGMLGLPTLTHDPVCTLQLTRSRIPKLPSYKLGMLADRFGFPNDHAHRALADAERVMYLWLLLNRG